MSDIGLSNAGAELHFRADQREVLGVDLPHERVVGKGLSRRRECSLLPFVQAASFRSRAIARGWAVCHAWGD